MSANRRAAENFGPHLRMRNQATDASDALTTNQINDKLDFGRAFKKQSDNQHDGQRDKGIQVKQRQRCVNRKFDPPGQGTLPVAVSVDRSGLTIRGVGLADFGNRRLDKKLFAPMPEQYQARRDRVKPAALRNEHG